MAHESQRTLDLGKPDREIAQRDSMITTLPIPDRLKSTLRAIYHIAMNRQSTVRCESVTVTASDISISLRRSTRTVRRNARCLERLELLSISRPRGETATYRIHWPSIFSGKFREGQSEPRTNQSEPLTKVSGVIRTLCQGSEQSKSLGSHTTSVDGKKVGTALASCRGKNEMKFIKANAVPKTPGGWPFPVNQKSLRTLVSTQSLYEYAVRRGWIIASACTRLGFFAAAVQARGHSTEPGPLFTWFVKNKSWTSKKHISDTSEEVARKAIAKLDNPKPPPATETPAQTHPDTRKDHPATEPDSIKQILETRKHGCHENHIAARC